MEIDQIAAELRVITEHIGSLDAEAVSSAKTILGLPRYADAEAEHPADAFVAHLKKIIAALPSDMTKPARLLFSLTKEGTNITHRKKETGVEGSGWMWLRTAILQRIAVAILRVEIQESAHPSLLTPAGFSVNALTIWTSLRNRAAALGLPVVRLQWHVDRAHPCARVFTFYFDAPSPLFDWSVTKPKQGALARALDRVPASRIGLGDNAYFFAIDLGSPKDDPLYPGEDVEATLILKAPAKQHLFIEHTVTYEMSALLLTAVLPTLRQECQLVEFESGAADAQVLSTRAVGPLAEGYYTVPAGVSNPVVGRRYRLEWEPQEPNLLTSLLHR